MAAFAYPSNSRPAGVPRAPGSGSPRTLERFIPPRPLTAPPGFPLARNIAPLRGLLGPWGFLLAAGGYLAWELYNQWLKQSGLPAGVTVLCGTPGAEWMTSLGTGASNCTAFNGNTGAGFAIDTTPFANKTTQKIAFWDGTDINGVPAIKLNAQNGVLFNNNNFPGAVGAQMGTEAVNVPHPLSPVVPQMPDIPEIPAILPTIAPHIIPPLLTPGFTPQPLPWGLIPLRPTVPGPSDLPGPQTGPTPLPQPSPTPVPETAVDPMGNPIPWIQIRPMPLPHLAPLPHRPVVPGPELKTYIGTPASVKKLLHWVSEPHDLVDATHKCIPKKWRDQTPKLYSGRRAPRIIGKHLITDMLATHSKFLSEASNQQIRDWIKCSAVAIADNELEDAIFGLLGGMVARVSRQLALPVGIERLANLLWPEASPTGNVGRFLRNYAKLPVPVPD